jgi:hypothetical protein
LFSFTSFCFVNSWLKKLSVFGVSQVRRHSGLISLNGDAAALKKAFVLNGSENQA